MVSYNMSGLESPYKKVLKSMEKRAVEEAKKSSGVFEPLKVSMPKLLIPKPLKEAKNVITDPFSVVKNKMKTKIQLQQQQKENIENLKTEIAVEQKKSSNKNRNILIALGVSSLGVMAFILGN